MLKARKTTVNLNSKVGSLLGKAKQFAEDAEKMNNAAATKNNSAMRADSLAQDLAERKRQRGIAAFEAELDRLLVNQDDLTSDLLKAQRSYSNQVTQAQKFETEQEIIALPASLKVGSPKQQLAEKIKMLVPEKKVVFANQVEEVDPDGNRSLSFRIYGNEISRNQEQQPLRHYAFENSQRRAERRAELSANLEFKANVIAFLLTVLIVALGIWLLQLYSASNMRNQLQKEATCGIKFTAG